jgi:hypothetical protein
MELIMMVILKITICMVTEFYILNKINQLIKGSGRMILLMGSGNYIINYLPHSMINLILMILDY